MPITCAQCSRAFAWKQPRHEQLWLRETNSTALWPDLCLCRSASKHLLRVPQKRKAATKTFPSNLDPQTWNVWKRIINGKISLWEDTRSLISELAFRIVKKRLNSFADRWHLTCVVHANLYSRKRTWDALIEKSFLQEQFPRKRVFNSTKPNNPDITHQDNPEALKEYVLFTFFRPRFWWPPSNLTCISWDQVGTVIVSGITSDRVTNSHQAIWSHNLQWLSTFTVTQITSNNDNYNNHWCIRCIQYQVTKSRDCRCIFRNSTIHTCMLQAQISKNFRGNPTQSEALNIFTQCEALLRWAAYWRWLAR